MAFGSTLTGDSGLSKIVVTGGRGKAGRACVKDLLAHGYDVFNIDPVAPAEKLCPFILADLADFGQAIEALSSVDFGPHDVAGVVHLAAIPTPMRYTNSVTFANNILSTYNVFEAARRLGIKNIVWASSETVLGLPFDVPPVYVPIDEEAPGRPESAYSLSKLLGEEMAKQFCRWDPSLKIVGAQVLEHHGAEGLCEVRRRSTVTHRSASGTSGDTSTPGTQPRRFARRSRRLSRAQRRSS